jgi:hypothetical protein
MPYRKHEKPITKKRVNGVSAVPGLALWSNGSGNCALKEQQTFPSETSADFRCAISQKTRPVRI